MKILSLFDGISCARVALDRAGIKVNNYYSSEIDRFALSISAKNYPDIVQVGSVVDFHPTPLICGQIDLMVGGFPCTDLSIAKRNRQGLKGEASGLFYEMIRVHKEVKPKFFIYENVASMSKENKEIILKTIQEIDPSAYVIMINASLVSAQNRKRLFFTNIPNVTLPEDRGILLKDILEQDVDEKYFVKGVDVTMQGKVVGRDLEKSHSLMARDYKGFGNQAMTGVKTGLYAVALTETRTDEAKKARSEHMKETGKDYSPRRDKELKPRNDFKANTITTGTTKESLIITDHLIRKLTPTECERLQSLPDNYTEGVSNSQRYKMLGNAFNVDVVAHILYSLDKPLTKGLTSRNNLLIN